MMISLAKMPQSIQEAAILLLEWISIHHLVPLNQLLIQVTCSATIHPTLFKTILPLNLLTISGEMIGAKIKIKMIIGIKTIMFKRKIRSQNQFTIKIKVIITTVMISSITINMIPVFISNLNTKEITTLVISTTTIKMTIKDTMTTTMMVKMII